MASDLFQRKGEDERKDRKETGLKAGWINERE